MKLQKAWPLFVILAVYLSLGALFAIRVPAWQVPDEPAHYNYVAQLARGIWPQIETRDWEPGLTPIAPNAKNIPVERITYQDHQPPLYYALLAPAFLLSNGSLIAVRLFSLLISMIGVVACYYAALTIFPERRGLAALAAVFYALLPQHLHVMAGVNNDALSEALITLTVLQSLRLIRLNEQATLRSRVLLGFTVGLAMFTKAQAYLALPIAALAVLAAGSWDALRARPAAVFKHLIAPGAVACAVALPLWVRNISTYGGTDFLGLQRHNAVVVGQTTTAAWIAEFGLAGTVRKALETTFQSFWGQFGWMSVTNDRLYAIALVITALSAALFVAWWLRRVTDAVQARQLTLLAILMGFALATYGWYNLQFVQHQGRYLYPALIPIAIAFALAWARPRVERWAWLAGLGAFSALDLWLLLRVILPSMR